MAFMDILGGILILVVWPITYIIISFILLIYSLVLFIKITTGYNIR